MGTVFVRGGGEGGGGGLPGQVPPANFRRSSIRVPPPMVGLMCPSNFSANSRCGARCGGSAGKKKDIRCTVRRTVTMAAHEQKNKESRYEKRKSTILRKSRELSILCDVKVCVVIVSPDGAKLETWPESLEDVKAALDEAAASDKRHRSDGNRKRRRQNPSGSETPEDEEKAMVLAITPDCPAVNNVAEEEEDAGGVVVDAGKKTEHYLGPSHTNSYGNLGFPSGIGDYYFYNYSYPGINNYENQIIHHHHHQESGSDLYFGDPSCSSSSSYGGGGAGIMFENQIPPPQLGGNGNYDFAEGTVNNGAVNNVYYDPLWVEPLQSIGNPRFEGDFQFGNYYYPY
ncbi:hypothetical protein DM860_011062 [Cuscuta australis]|uniref:MADS-box domain-containing protein n=1 Tax=Cuscuta australis TaxID=267555 RepID=A0A328E235_9ASTE|nr:hypothetical protein DM860_011062 [Cuscuta australis]